MEYTVLRKIMTDNLVVPGAVPRIVVQPGALVKPGKATWCTLLYKNTQIIMEPHSTTKNHNC